MQEPVVTVYITNYNYSNFIKQSIESVLQQSFQNFELLIIDDGSTDNSRDVIELYRNYSQVSIIYQKNKGLNITNNIAMRAANGKYIVRLDADDYLAPNALEQMVNVLEADENLGLVFPDYYYVDAQGSITGEERRHNFEKEVSLYDQPAHGACTMIRLSFLKDLGGYNESFTCQDGYELWIKFITHHKVTNINKPLFFYRRHGNNLTTNEERILDTRKKIKEYYVQQYLKLPKTLAIIPVRNTFVGDINWPLYEVNGKTILEQKVETCLEASKIHCIVISSADHEILEFASKRFSGERVKIVERPKAFQRANESLNSTIQHALEISQKDGTLFDAVMTVSLEYPFVKADVLDEAVNTLALFKADSVLSVRPDNSMYYQHTGHTLKPILDQDKFTKLEREALYKGAGGVVVSTVENFRRNEKLLHGSISHVVVDRQTALGVFSLFDLYLYNKLQESLQPVKD